MVLRFSHFEFVNVPKQMNWQLMILCNPCTDLKSPRETKLGISWMWVETYPLSENVISQGNLVIDIKPSNTQKYDFRVKFQFFRG